MHLINIGYRPFLNIRRIGVGVKGGFVGCVNGVGNVAIVYGG